MARINKDCEQTSCMDYLSVNLKTIRGYFVTKSTLVKSTDGVHAMHDSIGKTQKGANEFCCLNPSI